MIEFKVEFESDDELDEMFKEIEYIQDTFKNECGWEWHTLTYFYYGPQEGYWRFDWEYMWNRSHKDLKELLSMAIEAGRDLCPKKPK